MTSRTRTHALVTTGATALLLVALSGCGSGTDGAPAEQKSFPYSGKALTIDSGNSRVDVVPADVEQIEVTRRVDGWVVFGSGPDATWKLEGGTLTLKVKCSAVISNCDAHHEVKVPRGTALTVDADNGKVTASGFATPSSCPPATAKSSYVIPVGRWSWPRTTAPSWPSGSPGLPWSRVRRTER